MVNVRVREKNKINIGRRERQFAVFINVRALFHAAIHQNLIFADFKQRAGTGHFVRRPQKSDFHVQSPFDHFLFIITKNNGAVNGRTFFRKENLTFCAENVTLY